MENRRGSILIEVQKESFGKWRSQSELREKDGGIKIGREGKRGKGTAAAVTTTSTITTKG